MYLLYVFVSHSVDIFVTLYLHKLIIAANIVSHSDAAGQVCLRAMQARALLVSCLQQLCLVNIFVHAR